VAQLDTIKVVEYTRGAARVRQTTELRAGIAALLKSLGVALPPRLHARRRGRIRLVTRENLQIGG
jgi:hypothetical protein